MRTEQKSNNPAAIEQEGAEVLQKLLEENPLLRPDQLAAINQLYQQFYLRRDGFRIWTTPQTQIEFSRHTFRHPKVLMLVSGVAASGKNRLTDQITQLCLDELCLEDFVKRVVTATSRKPRADEVHRRDYFFYNGPEALLAAGASGELLEISFQSNQRIYGLPKRSLIEALAGPEFIIFSHVEMTAWPVVEKFIEDVYGDSPNKPFVLKVFVMPEMPAQQYVENWLPHHRHDPQGRAVRAGWELLHAPMADLILSNIMDQRGLALRLEAQALINILKPLLHHGLRCPHFPFPQAAADVKTTEELLVFQDSLLV